MESAVRSPEQKETPSPKEKESDILIVDMRENSDEPSARRSAAGRSKAVSCGSRPVASPTKEPQS
eukprot:1533376-Prymnesium_polylepis.1